MASSTAGETSGLLTGRPAPAPSSGGVEEYSSMAVVVVENEDHEPVIVHDLYGPVLPDGPNIERQDSIISSIWSVIDETADIEEFPDHADFPDHPAEDSGGQATVPSEIASMTKNLIGCGALSLCNGIALCADTSSALIAAVFWIFVMGAIFGYYCWLIAKICKVTGRQTYRGIWQDTVGHKGSMAVSVANALKAALADLAYATILADTLSSLLASINWHVPRVVCLFLITVFAILPLCMLKDLHVLAPFSVVGTAGIIFTALAMAVRFFDGSYLPGGKYHDDIQPDYQPSFGTMNGSWTTGILPFVCMVYEAYVMHYNSPRFYSELKHRSLPRYGIAVSSSFGISAVMYSAIACFGFLTFGGNSSSYILNNYSPHDSLALVSRLAVGLSTLIAYPIVFMGVRDGVLDIFEVSLVDQKGLKLNYLTFLLLGLLTIVAVFVTDLGLINAVGGGLVSTAIVFVFPTIMFHSLVKQLDDTTQRKELVLTGGLTLVGGIFGIIGAWTAVMGSSSS